jgi:hypothetical protein
MDALERFEAMMERQTLRMYPRTMDSEQLALPSMARIFQRQLRATEGVPTEERFLKAVVEEAPEFPEMSVRARASRAYPAFVRQEHFRVALLTRSGLQGVYWIIDLDMLGVDLLVLDHGCALGIEMSVQTDTAADWQLVKHRRHAALPGLEMLELKADPMSAPRIGPFWVHPLGDVWTVQDAMETLHRWAQIA